MLARVKVSNAKQNMASPDNVSPEKSKHGNRTHPDFYHWIEKLEKEFFVIQYDPDDSSDRFTSGRARWAWDDRLCDLLNWAYGFVPVGMCPDLAVHMLVNDFLGPGLLEPVQERTFTYYEQLEELEAQLAIDKEDTVIYWRIHNVWWEICRDNLSRGPSPYLSLTQLLHKAMYLFGNWKSDLKKFTDAMEQSPKWGAMESLLYFEERYGIVVTEPEDEDYILTFSQRVKSVELKAKPEIHCYEFRRIPILTRLKRLEGYDGSND